MSTSRKKPEPYDDEKARRWGHRTPRTPVQIPKLYAEVGKRAAKKAGYDFVSWLKLLIRSHAQAEGVPGAKSLD